jgi:hypothetical protein
LGRLEELKVAERKLSAAAPESAAAKIVNPLRSNTKRMASKSSSAGNDNADSLNKEQACITAEMYASHRGLSRAVALVAQAVHFFRYSVF